MPESIETARAIAVLGEVYWDGAVGFRGRHPTQGVLEDWREALKDFCGYTGQRAGASPKYTLAARNTIESYPAPSPRPDFVSWCADAYEVELSRLGIRPNPKLSPYGPEVGGRNRLVTRFVLDETGESDWNIARWAEQGLRRRNWRVTFDALTTIRGVGPKIASYYLRDVGHDLGCPEPPSELAYCFQPIDRWVERGAVRLTNGHPGGDKRELARDLQQLAQQAGVSGALLNAGLFLLGAKVIGQIAEPWLMEGTEEAWESALGDPKMLRGVLELAERGSQAWAEALGTVLAGS